MSIQYSDRNLIINYLPQSMQKEELLELFAGAGEVENCQIICDKASGLSYGFGFCKFGNKEDADRAIQMYNGYKLQNKTLKVAFARLQGQETKNCNVYVSNLPNTVTEDDVYNTFSNYGNIIQYRLVQVGKGNPNSTQIAFVLFEIHKSAMDCINDLNGSYWPDSDNKIQVRLADENAKKVNKNQDYGRANNASSGGPMRNSYQSAYNRFSPLGMPKGGPSPMQMMNTFFRAMSQEYGSGMSQSALASSGFGAQHGYSDDHYGASEMGGMGSGMGRRMGNGMMGMGAAAAGVMGNGSSGAKEHDLGNNVVFVYNIGNDTSYNDLLGHFSQYGPVARIDLPMEDDGNRNKNIAFIYYHDGFTANRVVQLTDSSMFKGRKLQASIKKQKNRK